MAVLGHLLAQLDQNLENIRLSLQELQQLLGQVKVIGRDVNAAGPIFAPNGIRILSAYALDQGPSAASLEALRCLANALLLNESCRQTFVDIGSASKAAERLKLDDYDCEFVISRILFLLTYKTTADFVALVQQNDLANTIDRKIARHAKLNTSGFDQRQPDTSPIGDMAMVETLKLTFNLTYHHPSLVTNFTPAIKPLVELVLDYPLQSPPLQSPTTYILNALLNLDLPASGTSTAPDTTPSANPLFPTSRPESLIERLTTILDRALQTQPEAELDQAAAPLCTLLRRLYALAPAGVQQWMRDTLLPSETERERPLGNSDTAASRLLRASCAPLLPGLRDNISGLLFELSGSDADAFVRNVGYGFAAGFLMNHNIGVPASATGGERGSAETSAVSQDPINPVTGQRLSAEDREHAERALEEMTDEEKEREAERLFVLFERLKATGVVDIQNPVQQAIEEGRFEEVD